ncbi:hypothetical protein JHK87_024980 [Glycine soja]|nr:hypothetical protein JHK87_024980 [Glycine soja]
MYLAAIADSQPQPSPLAGQVHHTVGDITATTFLSASIARRHAQPTWHELQWKSRPPHAAKNKEKITTFDIMGVCERKRKKKGNYSDDVDSNSVEKVVAMWERRLSLKLLLAALNGKESAIAMCKFCRLMGTTTGELLLNRYMVKGAEAVHAANPDVLVILSGLNFDTSLSFIRDRPVSLTFKGKLVFEVHRYGFTDGGAWADGNPNQVAELDLDWAYWTLVGSYYFREGVIGMEEFYGLLTWDWTQITRV